MHTPLLSRGRPNTQDMLRITVTDCCHHNESQNLGPHRASANPWKTVQEL